MKQKFFCLIQFFVNTITITFYDMNIVPIIYVSIALYKTTVWKREKMSFCTEEKMKWIFFLLPFLFSFSVKCFCYLMKKIKRYYRVMLKIKPQRVSDWRRLNEIFSTRKKREEEEGTKISLCAERSSQMKVRKEKVYKCKKAIGGEDEKYPYTWFGISVFR